MKIRILIWFGTLVVFGCAAPRVTGPETVETAEETSATEEDEDNQIADAGQGRSSTPAPQPLAIIDAEPASYDASDADSYCEHVEADAVQPADDEADVGRGPSCEVIEERANAAIIATKDGDGWRVHLLVFDGKTSIISIEDGGGLTSADDLDIWDFAVNPARASLRYSIEGREMRLEAVCAIAKSKRCEFFEVNE